MGEGGFNSQTNPSSLPAVVFFYVSLQNCKLQYRMCPIKCLTCLENTSFWKSTIMTGQLIFTCVAEGESRSRSAVTPSVCLFVRLSVRPSQNLVIATPLKLLIQLS